MKAKWITTAILASALTAPAFAGVGVYIGTAPPPLRYEVRAAYAGPGLRLGRWILELERRQICVGPRSMAPASLRGRILDSSSLRPL